MSIRRLVYAGTISGAADNHDEQVLTVTPDENKQIQSEYTMNIVNGINAICNVTVCNVEGINDCELGVFSIGALKNRSIPLRSAFVPKVLKVKIDPLANGTGTVAVSIYESGANI